MNKSYKFSPCVCEHAVRMVQVHLGIKATRDLAAVTGIGAVFFPNMSPLYERTSTFFAG